MTYYAYQSIKPVVSPNAYVHDSAIIIGDVVIGDNVYVGPGAIMRGDCARLILKEGSNLQDGCIVHALPDYETVVEENGHIGHGVLLHGCIIKKNAMVGMQSTVMDGAVVGENSFIGANSLVPSFKQIPDNVLAVGSPAKVIRELTRDDIDWKIAGTKIYQDFARGALAGDIVAIDKPLTELDENRPKLTTQYKTLRDSKKQ